MKNSRKIGIAVAGLIASLCLGPLAGVQARPRPVAPRSTPSPPLPVSAAALNISTIWPSYDEILMVASTGIMPARGSSWDASGKLTAGMMLDALQRLQKVYARNGMTTPQLPSVASRSQALTREEAVSLLVKAIVPTGMAPMWSDDQLRMTVIDAGSVGVPYRESVTLAAENLFVPSPLRPADPADRAFAAAILARAYPITAGNVNERSPYADEIRKALALHELFTAGPFPESAPVTTGVLARAIARTRMYLPAERLPNLPSLPVSSEDRHLLTRAEAITMAVTGLVADSRLGGRTAAQGQVEDPDVRVAYYLKPEDYLAKFHDLDSIPSPDKLAVAAATYKGWLANLSNEAGFLKPGSLATMGYVANMLARAVNRPGDYTGIVIDMSALNALPRSGGMYIIDAGDSETNEMMARQVYPVAMHLPVGPFFTAPGALGYYGDVEAAQNGRAGHNPLIIKALDWAKYDWSTLHGDPGLRRGGGKAIPLMKYPFVRGTPALVLLSPSDARKIAELDHKSLLLRKARVGLVHPDWDLLKHVGTSPEEGPTYDVSNE